MPVDRQQRQHNAPTCTNTGRHDVSRSQHSQHVSTRVLTLLTSADSRQPAKRAGSRIALTLLTLPALPAHRNSHRIKGD